MAPRAVLVGMPGSGKSTIGRRLARALGVELLDTDVAIVERTGRSIAEIFADGEPAFRRVESEVVRAALAEHDGIVSLGGGAVTIPEVRQALAGHVVVYLEISAAEGIRRTSGTATRPLLAGPDAQDRYRTLMTDRAPLYREVATLAVNTNRRNPGAVVRQIHHRLLVAECRSRRRRSGWPRLPTVLEPGPASAAPPSPAALARRARSRHE